MRNDEIKRDIGSRQMKRDRGFNRELESFLYGTGIESLATGSSVLELGCGDGSCVSEIGKRYSFRSYGLDISDAYLPVKGFDFVRGDIESLPFRDSSFDFVYSFMAFRYVPDKLEGLKEIHRVLKQGACAFIDFGNVEEALGTVGPYGLGPCINPFLGEMLESYPNENQVTYEPWEVPHAGISLMLCRVKIEKWGKSLTYPSLKSAIFEWGRKRAVSCY